MDKIQTSYKLENVRVDQLKEGDRIDLEDDEIADQNTDELTNFEFELVEVTNTYSETHDCIRVDFADCSSIGFPPDHVVKRAVPTIILEITKDESDALAIECACCSSVSNYEGWQSLNSKNWEAREKAGWD